MNFVKLAGSLVVLMVLVINLSGANYDPDWLFTDSHEVIFSIFRYCDTARTGDHLCCSSEYDELPDTGDSWDGSVYIILDYQFSSDSLYIFSKYNRDEVVYRD